MKANLRVAPVSLLPDVKLHIAHPASGLRRLVGEYGHGNAMTPPYWAYPWPGGAALARHILDRPETVAGRRVLDLGAGSGIVGIAAAKAGASAVIAAETDRLAIIALGLNAAANEIALTVMADDILAMAPPPVDLIAVGDLFYEPSLARRVTAFLKRCTAAEIEVLVGDPGRAYLPRTRLRLLAEYPVPDVGDGRDSVTKSSMVFLFEG